jgi:dolichol-phosphate mannosyltransferase
MNMEPTALETRILPKVATPSPAPAAKADFLPPSFCVVLPMYNEEPGAEKCVRTIYNHLQTMNRRTAIICVNDGSRDLTGEKLRALQPSIPALIVVEHETNKGYGAANVTGARRAQSENFDYILFMDGDLTQRVNYIDDFLVEMIKGTDFIKATRYSKGGGVNGVPFKRWFVSYVGNLLAWIFLRLPIRDYTNGFRAVKTSLIGQIECQERGFAYLVEEVYHLKKVAKTYAEVPYILTVRPEAFSASKFRYSFRLYYNYLKYLWKK